MKDNVCKPIPLNWYLCIGCPQRGWLSLSNLCVIHTNVAAAQENQQSAIVKTKTQNSFAVTAKLICPFVFAKRIVQFLLFLNLKFQASSVIVQPGL